MGSPAIFLVCKRKAFGKEYALESNGEYGVVNTVWFGVSALYKHSVFSLV